MKVKSTLLVPTALPITGSKTARLSYTFGHGAQGTFDFGDLDWWKTIQLNAERGTIITLRTHTR